MSVGKPWIKFDCSAEQLSSFLMPLTSHLVKIPHALPDHIPRAEIVASTYCRAAFALQQFRFDCPRNLLGDFVLNCENIGKIAIVSFGPKMIARAGVD
jgi:hypothetical protein